jgi:hypothetical protein
MAGCLAHSQARDEGGALQHRHHVRRRRWGRRMRAAGGERSRRPWLPCRTWTCSHAAGDNKEREKDMDWQRARTSDSRHRPPWLPVGASPDGDSGLHFRNREHGEREEGEGKVMGRSPRAIAPWRGRSMRARWVLARNRGSSGARYREGEREAGRRKLLGRAVGEGNVWACDLFTVHDLNHGMRLYFR